MSSWLHRAAGQMAKRVSPSAWEILRLGTHAKSWLLPPPPAEPDETPYIPRGVIGSQGIDFHADEQLAALASWKADRYQALFAQLRDDPAINTDCRGQGRLHNGYYATPDAEIYAAMIVAHKPNVIVEVGSGFSTLIARAAVRSAGYDTRIVVIDPSPRTDVRAAADEVILRPVEQSGLVQRQLGAGDLLFIDSSHTCRTRGDLPYLFCQVLPSLPAGVLVHVHDIFLPYDYPNVYDRRCYTEQYLLHCLLAHSPRYRTRLATHWLAREHGDSLRAVFGDEVGRDPYFLGGSYWLDVRT